MSNGPSTHKQSSKQGSKTDTSMTHPSSPIYLPSGVNSLEDWLIWCQADSLASRIQWQGNSEGLTMSGISGLTRSELSVRWDQGTSSWKTSQVSFLHLLTEGEDQRMGEPWSESLPPSGTVSIGKQSVLTMWAHPTDASGGGVSGSWSTPRVSGQEGYETRATRKGHDIAMSYLESQAEYITENWATPRAVDWKGSGPTVIRKDGKSRMDKLVYQAELSQHGPQAPVTQTHGSVLYENDQTSPRPSPKRLNPRFVEWLMGLPIGWTDLRPMTE